MFMPQLRPSPWVYFVELASLTMAWHPHEPCLMAFCAGKKPASPPGNPFAHQSGSRSMVVQTLLLSEIIAANWMHVDSIYSGLLLSRDLSCHGWGPLLPSQISSSRGPSSHLTSQGTHSFIPHSFCLSNPVLLEYACHFWAHWCTCPCGLGLILRQGHRSTASMGPESPDTETQNPQVSTLLS